MLAKFSPGILRVRSFYTNISTSRASSLCQCAKNPFPCSASGRLNKKEPPNLLNFSFRGGVRDPEAWPKEGIWTGLQGHEAVVRDLQHASFSRFYCKQKS